MPLTFYEDKILLSPTYCRQELQRLNSRYCLKSSSLFRDEDELSRICDEIAYYTEREAEIANDWGKLSLEGLLSFIAEQMASQIKAHSFRSISSVTFWKVHTRAVQIEISNVFSVILAFGENLYDVDSMYNEHYDGYHDLCEYVTKSTPNAFLREISSKLKNLLHEKLPDMEIKFILY